MARSSDPKKLALWQGRFRRFLASGLSVARFCAVEQVSESSFYYWQKRLGVQALHRSARAKDHDACAKDRDGRANDHDACAEHHDARAKDRDGRAEDHDICAGNHDARSEGRGLFQPVTVAPTRCGVVIRLPGGTRIEVDADHLDAIRAVVAETVRVDHGWAADRNASPDNQVIRTSDNHLIRKRGGVSC